MSSGYFVRWFKPSDLPAYISGLNENLYECYDEARFRWKMTENPNSLGFVTIAVIEYSGEPIAFNSFLPLKVHQCGDIFPIVQGCDGFVHPDHRRMGLFQESIRFMVRELSDWDLAMLMGFNFAGSAGAAQKAGSTITSDVESLAANRSNLKLQRSGGVDVEEVELAEVLGIYEDWAKSTSLLHYHRSPDYMKWRYRHPLRRSCFYRVSKGGEDGYLIISIEPEDDKNNNIFLEDYTPTIQNSHILATALHEVLSSEDKVNEIYLTATTGSTVHAGAKALGFRTDHVYTLIMRNIKGLEQKDKQLFRKGVELTRVEGWHLTSSDVF